MFKSKFLVAFFIASIIVSYLKDVKNDKFGIAGILGSAIGMIIFPLIITYLIKGINLLFKRKLSDNAFLSTFSVCWILLALSSLVSVYAQSTNKNVGFTYSPSESEYSIVFTKKPEITTGAVNHNKNFIKGEIAELNLADGSTQRVEYFQLSKGTKLG